MNTDQLSEILELHKQWLLDSQTGKKANLSGADLRVADLYEANLSGADLSGADLRGAKFTVELHCALNPSKSNYDPQQFPFLALNPEFLQSVQSSTST
jgi:uncharacterized protein YjbI with pentapeptide repeats